MHRDNFTFVYSNYVATKYIKGDPMMMALNGLKHVMVRTNDTYL